MSNELKELLGKISEACCLIAADASGHPGADTRHNPEYNQNIYSARDHDSLYGQVSLHFERSGSSMHTPTDNYSYPEMTQEGYEWLMDKATAAAKRVGLQLASDRSVKTELQLTVINQEKGSVTVRFEKRLPKTEGGTSRNEGIDHDHGHGREPACRNLLAQYNAVLQKYPR